MRIIFFLIGFLSWVGTLSAAEGHKVTLDEAVATTLRLHPEINLAREQIEERDAVLKQQNGLFDSTFRFEASLQSETQTLFGNRLQQEAIRRFRLQVFADALGATASGIIEGLDDRNIGDISLLFNTECGPTESRVVINTDGDEQFDDVFRNNRIVLCVNSAGEVTGIIPIGSAFRDVQQEILLINDPLRSEIRDALVAGQIGDLLRIVARILNFTSDSLQFQRDRLEGIPEEVEFLTFDAFLAYQKNWRNGIVLTPFLSFNSTEENFVGKPLNPTLGGSLTPTTFLGTAGFDLKIPLGKGSGKKVNTAPEESAKADLDAAHESYLHTASERALDTVVAYWRLAAAQKRLEHLQTSVAVQERLTEKIGILIDSGSAIESEGVRAQARLSAVRGEVAAARSSVLQARVELGRSMGLTLDMVRHAPHAAQSLPSSFAGLPSVDALISEVASKRRDLRAAQNLYQSSEILAEAAKLNKRHQFDLTLGVFYNAFHESVNRRPSDLDGPIDDDPVGAERLYDIDGFSKAWQGMIPGASYHFGFRWLVPFRNRTARGRWLQAESSMDRSRILRDDLQRTAQVRIEGIFRALDHARAEAEDLGFLLKSQNQVLKDTEEIFALGGDATLLDTLVTEEQLTDGRLRMAGLQLQIVELEAQLLFESGLLLADRGEKEAVDPYDLTPFGVRLFSLPSNEQSKK